LQPPFDHPDIQHGRIFLNSRSECNSDFPKSALTLISEYQKLSGKRREIRQMQSTDWAPEHSEALREYLARGISFSKAARALNAEFGTAYSRSAAIGRAKRMGFAAPADRPDDFSGPAPMAKPPRLERPRQRYIPEAIRPMPVWKRKKMPKLRCVEIDPRHLSLFELEPADCRYPYGGDEEGEAITFCGHPRRPGSSYCAPHFHLTRGPGTASERAAGTVLLRLIAAA
jgi:GcrA cell cycle regulator